MDFDWTRLFVILTALALFNSAVITLLMTDI